MSEENPTFQRCPHDKENPYSMISRELIRDQSISPECRWLIIYLLANKDNWKINIRQIINHCKGQMGRDRVYAVIKEAIDSGYILREEFTTEKNLRRTRYFVSESPKFKKCLRLPDFQEAESENPEKPDYKEEASSKEKQKEGNASPSIEERLSNFLLSKIQNHKPNFTGKVIPKWLHDSQKLIKMRSSDELKKVIDWVCDDPFWSGVVMSPGNLLKNLDKIEMQMIKKSDSSPSKAQENQKLAEKVKEQFPDRNEIELGYNYIEFRMGRMGVPDPHLVFGDNGFEEQLHNNLRKIGLVFNEKR